MSGIFIALLSGALMSIQGVFNTEVTEHSGVWMAAGFVQLTAFAVCALLWVISGREGSVFDLFSVPHKYVLLGGVIGAFITYTVVKSMGELGAASAVLLIVVAQLLTAYLIELFGIFGVERVAFEWKKAVGMGLAIAGIILFRR